jgi:TM2 domain-containing membrane protein YozV
LTINGTNHRTNPPSGNTWAFTEVDYNSDEATPGKQSSLLSFLPRVMANQPFAGGTCMVIFVIVCNGIIGLICLVVAWQLWKLKDTLSGIANTLISVEHATHTVLNPAPGYIVKGQTGFQQLSDRYRKLEPQLAQVRQILSLFSLGQLVWRRSRLQRARSARRATRIRNRA